MAYDNEHKFKELADRLRKDIPISDNRWNDAQTVINRCEANEYHDFYSPDESPDGRMVGPKMLMVEDLRKIGMEDEAQKVMDGEYDQ